MRLTRVRSKSVAATVGLSAVVALALPASGHEVYGDWGSNDGGHDEDLVCETSSVDDGTTVTA